MAYQKLEDLLVKIKELKNTTIYPPAKKQQADEIIIEMLEACGADEKSKNIIKEFLRLYKEIEGEY